MQTDQTTTDGTTAPLTPGQRVVTVNRAGVPQSAGTVEAYRDHDEPYALVEFDGDRQRNRRVPRRHLTPVGCDECEQTGFIAERREGVTYPAPCGSCNQKTGRYWWDVEDYALTVVV